MNGIEAIKHLLGGGKARNDYHAPGNYVCLKPEGGFFLYGPRGEIGPYTWNRSSLCEMTWFPYPAPAEEKTEPEKVCGTCGGWKEWAAIGKGHCTVQESPQHTYYSYYSSRGCTEWRPISAEPPKPDPFWTVCGGPYISYLTHEKARAAAESMAKIHPGERFYVLPSDEYCIAEEIAVEPNWEEAWVKVRMILSLAHDDDSLDVLDKCDPRNKTEVKVVWQKAKERVL